MVPQVISSFSQCKCNFTYSVCVCVYLCVYYSYYLCNSTVHEWIKTSCIEVVTLVVSICLHTCNFIFFKDSFLLFVYFFLLFAVQCGYVRVCICALFILTCHTLISCLWRGFPSSLPLSAFLNLSNQMH